MGQYTKFSPSVTRVIAVSVSRDPKPAQILTSFHHGWLFELSKMTHNTGSRPFV